MTTSTRTYTETDHTQRQTTHTHARMDHTQTDAIPAHSSAQSVSKQTAERERPDDV